MFNYTVRVNKLNQPAGKIVGFATLIIDDVLEVNGFRIIDGSKGLFASPPQHQGKVKNPETGEIEPRWFDDVRFVGETGEKMRDEVKQAIVDEYQRAASTTNRAAAANAHVQMNNTATSAATSKEPLW